MATTYFLLLLFRIFNLDNRFPRMRFLLDIIILLCTHSAMSQKPANPIFNQKYFPGHKLVDSLFGNKPDFRLSKLLNSKKENLSSIKGKESMPIFKPENNNSMPIYDTDPSSTYFLKIYPNAEN